MSWTIRIYDMQRNLLSTYVNGVNIETGQIGIESILTATVEPPFGNCKEMQFIGRNDVLQVDARNIVQYLEDDVPVFWGPLIIYPSPLTRGAGPEDANADARNVFVVAGGMHLLTKSTVGPKIYNDEQYDVAVQMRMIGEEFGHPALIWDEAEMPITEVNSSIAASPYRNLKDLFDDMSKSVPNSFYGVQAEGKVFIKILNEVEE